MGLRKAAGAARSCWTDGFSLTRLADYLAPSLRSSYSQSTELSNSIGRAAAPVNSRFKAGVGLASGLFSRGTSGFSPQVGFAVSFRRSFWSNPGELSRRMKSELQWMRPRRDLFGGFGGSRHFGGSGYGDPQLVLGWLIAANVGVFFLWRTMSPKFMSSNFVVSADALKSGRLHTLVTSAFSQQDLHHLLSNMIGLYFFGSEIGRIFGGQKLMMLYLAGGVVGALSHVGYWSLIKPRLEGSYGKWYSRLYSPGLLGSSGAVNAIILLDILLFPKRIIYFNLFIPIPAALFGLIIVGSDLWAARDGQRSGTSAAAHLGGAAVGVLAFLKWRL
ncbi:hypothetical protein R1sor_023168 [Riccia sorocarpa]|uniref:Peptidase S54 rhomboid domain-containing protein n=1 Tax=Riccia sorocarpa TaxID=122646 RepID=A0ABD3GPY3_9MARC